jgi:glycosyltransferase involved in cell wall biosynthesis
VKILVYTQFCTPEPIFKSIPFAAELRRRGHDVRILTGFPNYPGGEFYPGYRLAAWQRDVIEGVPILRVPLIPSHNESFVGRALNYWSFASTSAFALWAGWRPDVVYVYNLVTLGLVAAAMRAARGIPFVIDVQDLWPDSVLQSGMTRPWIKGPLSYISNACYQRADMLVTLAPGMARELSARGVPTERLRTIYNWCDEHALFGGDAIATEPPIGFKGRFNILFAGNMGPAQGLESVVDAASLIATRQPAVQFVFMGGGILANALAEQARIRAPNNTLFIPNRPMREASRMMQHADALLIHLQPKPLFEFTIPSKTQAYLAMGRPVLAAIGNDAAELVESAKAGVRCRPGDPESIAAAAERLSRLNPDVLVAMGASGKRFYENRLSLSAGVSKWEELFTQVIAGR